ncbi:MAG: methionine adenosyltransferase [Rhodothermaceae bacterium]|nr:methionine adenosyltransferase [Rhodothermaceae bacterium]MXZ57765.1 methionine adenosyltransferase [Rhodothermaceae bacterium]MYB91723.1 methionine adenosyltransferase [Rhodothermaceae bacterium]MYD67563.1 methionine adenosyltransferase [Rhodothermaceae bacterium]MYG45530.1 methionine adenosyltransferase [Rhodothermaceae bacterium]
MSTYLFTSESVSEGHPDKVADQISDAILDEYLRQDPKSRVAVETMVTSNNVILAGEVNSRVEVSRAKIETIVRKVVRDIGYTYSDLDFNADTLEVTNHIHGQSPDIHKGVDGGKELGAGDQGMMFGFACRELEALHDGIPTLMPMPLMYAHGLVRELARIRKQKSIMPYLRPDSKSQVTVEYDSTGRTPKRIHTIVIATQHDAGVEQDEIRKDIEDHLLPLVIDGRLRDDKTELIVNSTGQFVEGGPHADAGLTGRKIIVDTYGGRGAHGGGAFSGKDPSKVDRSAAYAARYVAKNLVAADLADMVEIQLAYAIGEPKPVSIFVDSSGTAKHGLCDSALTRILQKTFKLKPRGIIDYLGLENPIYQETAAYGHFGRGCFPWEQLDAVEKLREYARIHSG